MCYIATRSFFTLMLPKALKTASLIHYLILKLALEITPQASVCHFNGGCSSEQLCEWESFSSERPLIMTEYGDRG